MTKISIHHTIQNFFYHYAGPAYLNNACEALFSKKFASLYDPNLYITNLVNITVSLHLTPFMHSHIVKIANATSSFWRTYITGESSNPSSKEEISLLIDRILYYCVSDAIAIKIVSFAIMRMSFLPKNLMDSFRIKMDFSLSSVAFQVISLVLDIISAPHQIGKRTPRKPSHESSGRRGIVVSAVNWRRDSPISAQGMNKLSTLKICNS